MESFQDSGRPNIFRLSVWRFGGTMTNMSVPIPMNDLDKAIMAMQRSPAAQPDLCRRLREGNLYLLVPFHPEVANEKMNYREGDPMPFAKVQTDRGVVVTVYSSEARALEGLKKAKVKPRTFMPAEMRALDVLAMLGKLELSMTVNKGCATGSITLPPKTLRVLADGSAFGPQHDDSEGEQLTLNRINPADYPTNLLVPVFEFLRQHKQFRAAWIFTRIMAGQPSPVHRPYYLLAFMEPRDSALFNDLCMVAHAARGKHEVNTSLTESNRPEVIASLFRQAQPFYVAADYQQPATLPA